jgi:hypothetical protein
VLLSWDNEGIEAFCPVELRSTFQVCEVTSWSKDLAVEIAGHDVINHAGAAALRIIADRTGLTSGLSRALAAPVSFPFMTGAGCWQTPRC